MKVRFRFITVNVESAKGEDLGKVSYIPLPNVDYIPKQETLEEAIERVFKEYSNNTSLAEGDYDYMMDKEDFKEASLEISKWMQKRRYSEEEVLQLLLDCRGENPIDVEKWFDQFKKK